MMFGFSTRPACVRRPSPRGRAPLAVEPLERRECPSGEIGLGGPGYSPGDEDDAPPSAIHSAAPQLTLSLSYGPGQTVVLSGRITAEEAGGHTVTFSGAATGTAVTEADGTFRFSVEEASLGLIRATADDPWGPDSIAAETAVTSAAPVISDFHVTRESGNTWTFQGRVTDEEAVGLEVRLGGLPSLMGQVATVDESGWFFLRVTLGEDEEGTATAQTTDSWGLESNMAEAPVRQS